MAGKRSLREIPPFNERQPSAMRIPNRIVIVADNPANTADFRTVLAAQPDLALAAVVTCASCSFNAVSQQRPDLVMLSLSMPDHRILELVKDLAVLHSGLRFLIVTCHGQELDAERILRAGAHGCVKSSSGATTWLAAARQILSGGSYFSWLPSSRPAAAPSLDQAALVLAG